MSQEAGVTSPVPLAVNSNRLIAAICGRVAVSFGSCLCGTRS